MASSAGVGTPTRLIFGGSFDPPHMGHFRMIEFVLGQEGVQSLDLVPARLSPFKEHAPPTPGRERLRMLELGLAATLDAELQKRIRIRTLELERPGPSYSVDTLTELASETPTETPGLLLGADSVEGLEQWKNPERILGGFAIWVVRRPGLDSAQVLARMATLMDRYGGPGMRLLDNPPVECSSTSVRRSLAAGLSVSACLPSVLLDYIRGRRLYATDGEPAA